MSHFPHHNLHRRPSFRLSVLPVAWMIGCMLFIICVLGAEYAVDWSKYALLSAAALAAGLVRWRYRRPWRYLLLGLRKSWRQVQPALVVLLFIAMVSTIWMLSGVVPALIDYGLQLLNPRFFLATAALICAVTSLFTGSSWTTIATLGVALQGIGTVFGYHQGWIAGAIISGAYFGDKVSPLSDTTVLASSSCGVPLMTHVRYMMFTSLPALFLAVLVFLGVGLWSGIATATATAAAATVEGLRQTFVITPWLLLVPIITALLIVFRVGTNLTLALSTLLGVVAMLVFQPQLVDQLALRFAAFGDAGRVLAILRSLVTGNTFSTGNALLDTLTSTGGILGMVPTYIIILSAMVFGGALMGTGMLSALTDAITLRLRGVRRTVGATVGTGIFLNACTGDQYLSVILGGNIYKNIYRRQRLEPRLLSRTVEDSTSVTSVLIPWNSCGITQSSVLGVSTLVYLPFCLFNYLSPLMSLLMAYTGWTIRKPSERTPTELGRA